MNPMKARLVREWCAAFAFFALGLLFCVATVAVERISRGIDSLLDMKTGIPFLADSLIRDEGDKTREMLSAEIGAARGDLFDETSRTRADFFARVDMLSQNLNSTSDRALRLLDQRTADLTADVDRQLTAANGSLAEVARLRMDVQPAISGVNLLMQRNALPAQLLGLTGAAKVAAGETAQTMKTVRDQIPILLTDADHVVKNSDKTTASTAEVMDHLKTATKPLPTWVRIGLAVAPPLAGVASGIATTYSLTH